MSIERHTRLDFHGVIIRNSVGVVDLLERLADRLIRGHPARIVAGGIGYVSNREVQSEEVVYEKTRPRGVTGFADGVGADVRDDSDQVKQ